jgi:hypothetical protein
MNLVFAQKLLELLSVEICQEFIACYERGDIGLIRKLLHLFVRLPIPAYIDFLEPITFFAEVILRINTPGAPLAAVQLQLHRRRANKRQGFPQSNGTYF